MVIRFPRFTAARREKALAEAELEFAQTKLTRGKQKFVQIRPVEIKERLELYQPREFSHGATPVDGTWVRELARRMSIHGELDPPLVIRIGNHWVCVDGHHRLAAYRLKKHKKPIKCEWFSGTPSDAVDECMRRNNKDHLPIPLEDRCEEAWRRVLLDQGSKKQISEACNVSASTVSNMRRAKSDYEKDPKFAARVARPLLETSWGVMLLARGDVEEEDFDLNERSAKLARTIRGRLSDLLMRDAVVTAHAIAKYHGQLPRMLMDVWTGRMAMPAPRNLTAPEMKLQMEVLRHRADNIEKMLSEEARRRTVALAKAEKNADEKKRQRRELWLGPKEFDPHEDAEGIKKL